MSTYTLEVRTAGKRNGEVIWLDLSRCKVLKNGTQTLFLTDGVTCFSIYKGRRRKPKPLRNNRRARIRNRTPTKQGRNRAGCAFFFFKEMKVNPPKIDADLLGRYLTDEERNDPEIRKLIATLVVSFESGYYYFRVLKPTLIHEAGHAVYGEKFGCSRIVLDLPFVEIRNGKPYFVHALVWYSLPARVTAEQCLKIALAGPTAEEMLCPDPLRPKAQIKAARDYDLADMKPTYLERGGTEANFENDSGRMGIEIVEELNSRTVREAIYRTAERFRLQYPPCPLPGACYHQPIMSPESQKEVGRLTELLRETRDARVLFAELDGI